MTLSCLNFYLLVGAGLPANNGRFAGKPAPTGYVVFLECNDELTGFVFFVVAAELEAHGGEDFVGEVGFAT